MELTWIQKHVLLVLIRTPSARVKNLQPADIPSNQFMYHLEGLIARKLVVKLSRGTYALTPKGEKLAGTFSTSIAKQVEDVKTVILLYGKIDEQYLLFRWSRQPYFGFATPPHQRVARGESLARELEAALDNKLGSRQPVKYKISALIKITHNNEIVSHLNALIYEVPLERIKFPNILRNGEVFLDKPSEVHQIMDGVEEFFKKVETVTEPFDYEWRY